MLSLLPPKTLVNMLLGQIKKAYGDDFNTLKMVVKIENESMMFIIDGEEIEAEHEALRNMFIELSKQMQDHNIDEKIDLIVLDCEKSTKNYKLILCTQNEKGEKFKQIKPL